MGKKKRQTLENRKISKRENAKERWREE